MNATTLKPRTARWNIETSHLVTMPTHLEVTSIEDLRSQVQHLADTKQLRIDRPPIGTVTFRYELDEHEQPVKVHVLFKDQHKKLRRFMRLAKVG